MTQTLPWIPHNFYAPLPDMDVKRNNISQLWLFSDFVNSTIIGPIQKPLLRYAPIRVGSGVLEHSVFSTHQYAICKSTQFSCLSISFYEDLTCNSLQIHEPVVLTLHFKAIDDQHA